MAEPAPAPYVSELDKVAADERARSAANIKPVQGVARVRKLGRFGPPDPAGGRTDPSDVPEAPDDQPDDSVPAEGRTAALVLLVLMFVGALMIGIGIGAALGWYWGVGTMGALIFVVAFIESRNL